jgi:hypothetical protein
MGALWLLPPNASQVMVSESYFFWIIGPRHLCALALAISFFSVDDTPLVRPDARHLSPDPVTLR